MSDAAFERRVRPIYDALDARNSKVASADCSLIVQWVSGMFMLMLGPLQTRCSAAIMGYLPGAMHA